MQPGGFPVKLWTKLTSAERRPTATSIYVFMGASLNYNVWLHTQSLKLHVRRWARAAALTLVDVEEGLAELAAEQGLGQVAEELLHHVRHVVSRLVLVADVLGEALVHLPQGVDPRLHA